MIMQLSLRSKLKSLLYLLPRYHAAHLTNNEDWEVYCQKAGRASGDLSFPIVYCPELHFPEFNSAVADMKNSVAVSQKDLN